MSSDPKKSSMKRYNWNRRLAPLSPKSCWKAWILRKTFLYPISQEWMIEIRRRCEEIDKGSTSLLDNENVIAELRGKYA